MQRRGWATSEFWTAVAVGVASLAASLSGYLPPRYASIASAIAVAGYAIGRGLAKSSATSALATLELARQTMRTAPASPQATAPSATPPNTAANAESFAAVTAPPPGAE